MRPLSWLILICCAVWLCSLPAAGAELRLNNGDIVRGDPVSFNDDGVVVRLDIGGHSPRLSWSKLTQESLQLLAANPQATRFVEPFIELPPVPKDKEKKKRDITLKPVPRVDPVPNPGLFASILTPGGLGVFLILFLGNLYAAFEVARFRHRPPGLVCGLSILFPILAPAAFLAMPAAPDAEGEEPGLPEPSAAQAAGKITTGPLAKTPMASGLTVAGHGDKGAAAPASSGPQVFKRGEFTFNRRFMETKFPGFFRVIQSEADKDMVLAIRTGKDEHIAKRISRISTNEMHVQLAKGGELSIPFAEIVEVHLRHKDGKG